MGTSLKSFSFSSQGFIEVFIISMATESKSIFTPLCYCIMQHLSQIYQQSLEHVRSGQSSTESLAWNTNGDSQLTSCVLSTFIPRALPRPRGNTLEEISNTLEEICCHSLNSYQISWQLFGFEDLIFPCPEKFRESPAYHTQHGRGLSARTLCRHHSSILFTPRWALDIPRLNTRDFCLKEKGFTVSHNPRLG